MVVSLVRARCYRKSRDEQDPVLARKSFNLVDEVRCTQQLHVQGCSIKASKEGYSECVEEAVREGFLGEAALNCALKGKKDSNEQINRII